jgi:hypothetical protein
LIRVFIKPQFCGLANGSTNRISVSSSKIPMKKHRGSFLDVTRKPWDKAKQFGMAVELIRHILEEDPSPGDKEDSETMSVVSAIQDPPCDTAASVSQEWMRWILRVGQVLNFSSFQNGI